MKRRYRVITKVYWSNQLEPEEFSYRRRRWLWQAKLDLWLTSPNLGALAWHNTINPEQMVMGVEYEIREEAA